MGRCEAPWLKPCTTEATVLAMFEAEPLLVCDRCRRDLGDFELYHLDRDRLGPPAASESWWNKP